MKKLFAESNNSIYFLLENVERETAKAEMTLEEYIEAVQKINPQFERVYAV